MACAFSRCLALIFLIFVSNVANECKLVGAIAIRGVQEKSSDSESEQTFVVQKVSSQLQRTILQLEPTEADTVYYVAINGTLFFDKDQARHVKQLDARLAELAKPASGEEVGIFLAITYYGSLPQGPNQNKNAQQVAESLKKASLKKVRGQNGMSSDAQAWGRLLKLLDDKNEIEEDLAGDENVLVYSVHEPLSKMLGSGADCYVEINRKVVESKGFLDPTTRQSLSKCLKQITDLRKGRIYLRLKEVEASQGWPNRMKSELKSYIDELGFKELAFTYRPDRVRLAESAALIGGRAPDFELQDFATGKQVKLSDAGAGKFVILSFFGNTCGPCRKEAPYLEKLQTEFEDQGLWVIGANGFDDKKSKIEEFVSDCEIDYQILINGSKVARDQYYVTGYPTTFWIDRNGNIVKRLTGFDEKEFEAMRQDLVELLEKK